MRRTNLRGHALSSEGKAHIPGGEDQDPWVRAQRAIGYGVCQCGATSPELDSDAARKRWHGDVHKPEVRAREGRP
jgi:hypothetical protein